MASRTDAGVSAIANVFAFNTDFNEKDILNILNSRSDHSWFYGITQVDDDFNPRYARIRWYRYHIYNDNANNPNHIISKAGFQKLQKNGTTSILNLDFLKSVTKLFQGTHDFKNFAKSNLNNTVRTIESIEVNEEGNWITIDLRAQSFLWHQVRRLVNSWLKFTRGEIDQIVLQAALNAPEVEHDFGLAPAKPLFLMDIEYDFQFNIDKQLLINMYNRLITTWQDVKLNEKLLNYLFKTI